jgi:DNA-binding transcriptional LysR family regulator
VDQLEAMRVFVAVAESGNLSRAARALGLPVPSVSRKLAALEAHLDVRLVVRTTRRMALSDAGRRYLETCRRVVSEVDEASRTLTSAREEPRGSLSVTAPVVFGRLHVLPIVLEFLRAHPAVDVRLILADRTLEMIDEGVDVAIRIGALPDSTLIATKVGAMRRITCASPDYLRRRGRPTRPEELVAHDCITFVGIAAPDRWPYPIARGMRSVAVRSRLSVTTAEAAIDAAVAGFGVTRVLRYQAEAALEAGRLVRVLEKFEPPAAPVHVLHGDGRAPRAKVRAFTALAATRLRAALRG